MSEQLFVGLGMHLVVPYNLRSYPLDDCPICRRNVAEGRDRCENGPHMTCDKLKVPWGYWWKPGKVPKIIRQATADELMAVRDAEKEKK